MDQFSTDPLISDDSDEAERARNGSRDSLLLSARLITADGVDETVRVRNLSPGGLMAEYGAPIARGAPVKVELRGLGTVEGSVAWTAEGRIGIAFERKIDPMAARKPVKARSTSIPKPMRRAV